MEKITRKTAIVDSGFLYALINKKDPNHEKVKKSASKHNRRWMTTHFVFHEVFVLLNSRSFPYLIPNLFLMVKTELLEIVDFEKNQLIEIESIVTKYADQKLDLADASLILLAEKLDHGDIFTIDIKDFSSCRWNKNKHFNILVEQL